MAIGIGKKAVEDMSVENQPWNITAKVKVFAEEMPANRNAWDTLKKVSQPQ